MRSRLTVLLCCLLLFSGCGDTTGSEPGEALPPEQGQTTTVQQAETTARQTEAAPSTAGLAETSAPLEPEMMIGDRAPGLDLWATVPGNDLAADRVNLIFAPWGWDDPTTFVDLVTLALSWSGDAYLIDVNGELTTDRLLASDAAIGLFGIEPWRSSRDRFNVWHTTREPESPVAWLNSAELPFAVPDAVIVTVALDAQRFNPELTSVAGLEVAFTGPGPPRRPRSGTPFANATVVLDSGYPAAGLIELPHELGHAMFNLADEYVGEVMGFDGRSDLSSWPSCAEDRAEGTAWWGDLLGEVDPMVTIWADEMAEAGFPLPDPDIWAERVEVGLIDGGCYGIDSSARASADSLMNTSIPVLGSANRRWAEQIIRLWEGQARAAP